MTDDCDFLVFLLIAIEERFNFPCSLAELLGSLVDYLLGDEAEYSLLLFLGVSLSFFGKMLEASFLYLFT